MSNAQEFDANFFQLLMQLDVLQRKLTPLVGPASQKLVRDLVDSGCKLERLAKITDRSPGFVRAVYNGERSLNLRQTVKVLQHGIRSGENLVKN